MGSDVSGAAPSSTPPAVFSDEPARASTPPSSPPGFPWDKPTVSRDEYHSPQRPAKSAFSALGKRKALEPLNDNARPTKKPAASAFQAPKKDDKSRSLTQMQISLGQETQRKCKMCGMEYVPSSAEDRKLHDKYHKQNVEGYDVVRDFAWNGRAGSFRRGLKDGDWISALDHKDTLARKRRGQAILEIVQRELGAVEIPEGEIWEPEGPENGVDSRHSGYRAFLYIRRNKCIGFLLVQKIMEARTVVAATSTMTRTKTNSSEQDIGNGALSALKVREQAAIEHANAPITLSSFTSPAQLGICRIWTSVSHRHQKIATTLLDTALEYQDMTNIGDVLNGFQAVVDSMPKGKHQVLSDEEKCQLKALTKSLGSIESKDLVAFSQPTEAGTRLARKWFGKTYGWKVYVD